MTYLKTLVEVWRKLANEWKYKPFTTKEGHARNLTISNIFKTNANDLEEASAMDEDLVLKAIIPAILKIDAGREACISSFVEDANAGLEEAGCEKRFVFESREHDDPQWPGIITLVSEDPPISNELKINGARR